jgi:hypothetical protein
MAKREEIDDLDELIDKAVDTFFVEAPTDRERSAYPGGRAEADHISEPPGEPTQPLESPSFDEVMDTLFMDSSRESAPEDLRTPTETTSGDIEVDRAIDLAVETLFVEEPETPAPETAQLQMADSNEEDELFGQYLDIEASARKRMQEGAPGFAQVQGAESSSASAPELSYDDAMAMAIARHMNTLYREPQASPASAEAAAQDRTAAAPTGRPLSAQDALVLRKLQEAILTLEWEISRRSVTVLANELHKVRTRFQDNIAVDFAAMSMRIVLEYVVKRMSRAHPESVRFLLEVTDLLERLLASAEEDPLRSFHHIVHRYEAYKSVVRKAEGLPDRKPAIIGQLEIRDPDAFAGLVQGYAVTISKAGRSLAKRLKSSRDPENLIRSFRFLVTRSMNRILEKTLKEKAKTKSSHEKP